MTLEIANGTTKPVQYPVVFNGQLGIRQDSSGNNVLSMISIVDSIFVSQYFRQYAQGKKCEISLRIEKYEWLGRGIVHAIHKKIWVPIPWEPDGYYEFHDKVYVNGVDILPRLWNQALNVIVEDRGTGGYFKYFGSVEDIRPLSTFFLSIALLDEIQIKKTETVEEDDNEDWYNEPHSKRLEDGYYVD